MAVFTIASRELRAIFHTTIGWLVLAGFLFLNGIFFMVFLDFYAQASADFMGGAYGAATMTLTDHLLAPYYRNIATILLMVCPALSMRLYAEERRHKTLELLLTSPVTTTEIVLGKFLGAWGFVAVLLAGLLYIPALLGAWSTPDVGALLTAHLGLMLVAGAALAIGGLFSSLVDNQITALVLTIAANLALYVIGAVGGPDTLAGQVSLLNHLETLLTGGLRLSDLVYFAGLSGVFLFATHQRVESFRWS